MAARRFTDMNTTLASRDGVLAVDKTARTPLPRSLGKFSAVHIASVRRVPAGNDDDEACVPAISSTSSSLPENSQAALCRHWSPLRILRHDPADPLPTLPPDSNPVIVHVTDAVVASVRGGGSEGTHGERVVELLGGITCRYWEIDAPLPPLAPGARCAVYGRVYAAYNEPAYLHAYLVRAL